MAWHVDPARGDSGWAPHRDKGRCSLFADGTPKILNLWLPLTDATPLNGCMYVVPADRDPTYNTAQESSLQFQLSDIRALPARAGSVLGWTQAVIHWGARTAERGGAPRISLGAEFQCADLPPFATPLLDPAVMPVLAVRLDVIAQSILRHTHHGHDEAAATLARGLLG
jgi:ectoine hydroxylase-related dioxygenase (phytanoyl-CoA dioxygenase family)